MAKKFKSLLDFGEAWYQNQNAVKQVAKQIDTPKSVTPKQRGTRQRIYKPTPTISEKVYVPEFSTETKIKVPDKTVEALNAFHNTVDHLEVINGKRMPAWQESLSKRVIKAHPDALNKTPMPVNPVYPKYTSNDFGVKDYFSPQDYSKLTGVTTINTTPIGWTPTYTTSSVVSNIPDYFKPQQYRGIDNIDTMFEQAGSMSALGANNAARQFASAGLEDVAAIARGVKPTSFKYKSANVPVPMSVIEEIVTRRNAPAGTAQWLKNINVKNPNLGTNYLDMFARQPEYFKSMFDINGNMIK